MCQTLKPKPYPTFGAVYQHDTADEDLHTQEEEANFLDSRKDIDEIVTTHDDIYNKYTTTSTRPPHTKKLNPRKPHDKFKSCNPKPRYNGTVYLPTHIFHMLNEDVKKVLDQYNQDKTVQYKPNHTQMAKVHKQDTEGSEEEHNHPEPDLDNHLQEVIYPMQDPDIEELMEHHSPYSVNMASTYHMSKHSASSYGSLVDRGANGGIAGADVRVLQRTCRKVSVTGIDDHELPGLDIVTCVALIQTNHGKVNMLIHEYDYYGRGNTILSPCQIQFFQNTCDDKSHHVGGEQVITFLDGYATPCSADLASCTLVFWANPQIKI